MLQRRVYHVMAAVRRHLYVLGGNDLDYNNDRVLVRHIDAYHLDTDQWTRCSFNLLTGERPNTHSSDTCTHTHTGRPNFVSASTFAGHRGWPCITHTHTPQPNPVLPPSGQNEAGVAVHDDRIYVVGGYSIWTNEPLACIQVRSLTDSTLTSWEFVSSMFRYRHAPLVVFLEL